MTKVKLCGLTRSCDIAMANKYLPDYIGFVFAPNSRRYITPEKASLLKQQLTENILAVGVFVNEDVRTVATLLNTNTIDLAQLHGIEDDTYIKNLRTMTDKPIIKAFQINTLEDVMLAQNSTADTVLLDSGSGGTGMTFNWNLIQNLNRPYFLAGGLHPDNIHIALEAIRPFAIDVSSGIETNGVKDETKIAAFLAAVREFDGKDIKL